MRFLGMFLLLLIISLPGQKSALAQSRGCDEEARRLHNAFGSNGDFEVFKNAFCTPTIRLQESRFKHSLRDSQCKLQTIDGLLYYANRATSAIANDRVAINVWTDSLAKEPKDEPELLKHLVRLRDFDELLDSMIEVSEDQIALGTFDVSSGIRPVADFKSSPVSESSLNMPGMARNESIAQAILLKGIMAELHSRRTYAVSCATIDATESRNLDEIRFNIDQRLREHISELQSLKRQLNANVAQVMP